MAVLQSAEIATTANAESLDSDQLLVLAIGSSMGIESQILRNALGTDSNFSVQVIDDPTQLPPHYRDYGACDLLVVSTQDQELLGAIGQKWQAIDGWLRQGGNGVVSLAALKEETLADLPVLATLLPGKIVGTGMVTDPGPLESLVAAANDPLNRISVAILEPTRGEIKLSFKDSLGKQVPWWIHTAHGNGNVHVIASDLAQESFEEWRERGELWLRLLEAFYEREVIDGGLAAEGRKDSYLGYNDLVGQLRAGMDTFPSLTTLSFGQISAMLVCVLLVVGPLDYYLSIKVLKRPQFSWYFAGISLVVFCSGLLFLYQLIRPNEVHVNSVQIVDFDASNGKMSGQLWTHVYAGKANRLDLSVRLDDGNLKFESSTASPTVDWQGLPGNGLGGLDSQISAGSGMPPYEIVVGTSQEMLGVPIATAGTKCLNAHWMNDTSLQNTFRLQELAGVEQLAGEFTNPFQVDIRDAYIFYHKWFYRLNSRIPAGGRFVISADMIPKDFSRKLNERKTISENVSGTRWDPANRSNLDRMLEMLMFYRAASGRNYTGLDHRYQPHLDFSNLLETDTAVLVCRLEKPFASLNVEVEGATTPTVIQDVDRVWCRITIPITESVRFSSSSGL